MHSMVFTGPNKADGSYFNSNAVFELMQGTRHEVVVDSKQTYTTADLVGNTDLYWEIMDMALVIDCKTIALHDKMAAEAKAKYEEEKKAAA